MLVSDVQQSVSDRDREIFLFRFFFLLGCYKMLSTVPCAIRASLIAQLIKNLLAVWEAWVPSLGWEDPLEKGKATHSSILAWRIPWTVQFTESDTTEQLSLSLSRC